VLSGRGPCDELITRQEESYRLWCVVVCDLETSRMRRPWPALGLSATAKKNALLKFAVHFIVKWIQACRLRRRNCLHDRDCKCALVSNLGYQGEQPNIWNKKGYKNVKVRCLCDIHRSNNSGFSTAYLSMLYSRPSCFPHLTSRRLVLTCM
jgi:hypothetical protein